MTPVEITAAAKAEIDALRAKHKTWRDVKLHASSLSSEGVALASVLGRPEMETSVSAYAAASKRAEDAQRTQRTIGIIRDRIRPDKRQKFGPSRSTEGTTANVATLLQQDRRSSANGKMSENFVGWRR